MLIPKLIILKSKFPKARVTINDIRNAGTKGTPTFI
jgi:hypothetical protein